MAYLSRKTLAMSVFLMLLSPAGFYGAESVQAKDAPAAVSARTPEIVARVNGRDITKEDLEIAINNLMPIVSYHSSVSEKRLKQIRAQALEKIVTNELIFKYAVENKMDDVKAKEVDAKIAVIKKNLPKGDKLEAVLKRSNMTMDELKLDMKMGILVARVSQKKIEEFKKKAENAVNEAFMKAYYDKNLAKFKEPEQIHLKSILIKADPSGGQKAWNASLKKAQDILKQIRAGEDFAKIAELHSEDPNAKNGGDMGWAHKGSLFDEIDAAAEKMKPGEVSEPVSTIYGYHIVKLVDRKVSTQKKFEDLNKEKLEKELESKEQKMLWNAWITEMKSVAKIEYLDKK
ncbi:MAG: peptidylprolyl isomerase [Deltaproteobacteria bacterium]